MKPFTPIIVGVLGLMTGYTVGHVWDPGPAMVEAISEPSLPISEPPLPLVEKGCVRAPGGWVLHRAIPDNPAAISFTYVFDRVCNLDATDRLYKAGETIHLDTETASSCAGLEIHNAARGFPIKLECTKKEKP